MKLWFKEPLIYDARCEKWDKIFQEVNVQSKVMHVLILGDSDLLILRYWLWPKEIEVDAR